MQGKTFWGGAMLCAIGITATLLARQYRAGTLVQMGPGYFPIILGVLLTVLGGITCVQAALKGSAPITAPPWRQLVCIPLSVVCFALLIQRAGIAIAVAATVMIGCTGAHRFRPLEAVISAVILAVLTSALFVRLLGLPVSILPPG